MLLSKVEKDDCKEMLNGFNNMKAKVKLVEEPVERKVMGGKWFLIKFIVKVALEKAMCVARGSALLLSSHGRGI